MFDKFSYDEHRILLKKSAHEMSCSSIMIKPSIKKEYPLAQPRFHQMVGAVSPLGPDGPGGPDDFRRSLPYSMPVVTAVTFQPTGNSTMSDVYFALSEIVEKSGQNLEKQFGARIVAPGFAENGLVLPSEIVKDMSFPLGGSPISKVMGETSLVVSELKDSSDHNRSLEMSGLEPVPGEYTIHTSAYHSERDNVEIGRHVLHLDAYKVIRALRQHGVEVKPVVLENGEFHDKLFLLNSSKIRPELMKMHNLMKEVIRRNRLDDKNHDDFKKLYKDVIAEMGMQPVFDKNAKNTFYVVPIDNYVTMKNDALKKPDTPEIDFNSLRPTGLDVNNHNKGRV